MNGNVLHRMPMDGFSDVILASTLTSPAQRYALLITRWSTSSLTSSAYLIVRDPGHYRVVCCRAGLT